MLIARSLISDATNNMIKLFVKSQGGIILKKVHIEKIERFEGATKS